jgi:DNA polymerase-3 subunit epsilon
MHIIFMDTETSGLPLYKDPSEDPRQPHIVEIAALLIDSETGAMLDSYHTIVRPDGWTIPDDVAEIHGITTERAMDEGVPEHHALHGYLDLHARAHLRSAFNESFDQRIVRIGIKRFGEGKTQEDRDVIADAYKAFDVYCCMKASTRPCNLPPTPAMLKRGMKWNKNPTLAEAYKHFMGVDLQNAHSALADTRACADIYFALNPVQAVA